MKTQLWHSAGAYLIFFLIFCGICCPVDLGAQEPKRTLVAYSAADFSTGIEKMAVLYNQLYVYGFSGGSMNVKYETQVHLDGSHKLFVSKYNDTGNYLRTIAIGGTGANLNGYACNLGSAALCFSGVYSGGYMEGSTKVLSGNAKGMFVTALDSSLKNLWRLFLKANDKFHCNFLCPDGKGNLLAAGFFSDTLVAGSNMFISTRIYGQTTKTKDIFLLRISSTGAVLNALTFGGHGNDYPTGLTVDRKGNPVLSAVVSDTVILGDYEYKQQSKSRALVFKTDVSGHTFWATAFSGAGAVVNGIAYNGKNEIVCGTHFKSSLFIKSKTRTTKLNTNGDYNQIGVVLLDTFGNLVTYQTEGSENAVALTAMVLDASDNIYVSGDFDCTFTGLNAKNESWSFRNLGFGDIYLAAYTSKLVPMYQRHIGGFREDIATHLVHWNGKPTVCGSYKDNFQIACDSNVRINLMGYGNGGNFLDYYLGYSPGPHRRWVAIEHNWIKQRGGFFTDLVDIKGQHISHLEPTNFQGQPFTENAKWEFELLKRPNEFCAGGNLRFFWIKDNYYGSNYIGSKLEYTLNGKSYTRQEIRNYRFYTTTFHSLVINTEDRCYVDTLEATAIVVPEESVIIEYDKVKYPNRIVLCKDDSICLTANNTKGLKYFWIVRYPKYYLDTGNTYDTTDEWRYSYLKMDTFYSQKICVSKKAVVNLEVEKNNKCLRGRSLNIEKDKLGPDDSLLWFLKDTATNYCKGLNSAYTYFQLRVLDKKTGLYRYPDLYTTIKINGKSYAPSFQNEFHIPIPDTGQIRVSGTTQLGCDMYNFSLNKKVVLKKPTIDITGELSNCHSVDRIFTADSGFLTYSWGVSGLPDTPKITYITPWKIRVQGSLQQISVFGYADTTKGKSCYVGKYKGTSQGPRVSISSSLQPAQLCPGGKITLTAGNAQTYAWFPTGETTQSITVDEPGIYYCRVKDTGDCEYNTNTIQVEGYYDPDILVEPDDGVCFGEDAEIFIVAPNSAMVKWTTPTSWGSSRHITTKQLGTFYCDVKYCNITYRLKAQISNKIVDNKTLNWNYEICTGQKIKLGSHDSETYAYQWSPVGGSQRYYVADKAGTFSVQARDICNQWYTSDIHVITPSAASGKDIKFDTLICGLKSSDFNIRDKYGAAPDSAFSCLWLHDGDTSFKRKLPAGSGNYVALIKNKYCSVADTFQLGITNVNQTRVKLQPVLPVCAGDSVQLLATLSDTQASKSKIFWSHGLGYGATKRLRVLKPEWVYASIADTCGNSKDSARLTVHVLKAAYDIAYYADEDEVILTERCTGNNLVGFKWYVNGTLTGEGRVLKMPSPLTPDAVVCLVAENAAGCTDSVCKILPIYNKGQFYIPTAFRPNSGIAKNQRFHPFSKVPAEYTMLIFNRWGEKLFEGGSHTNGWDGTYMGSRCPNGFYVYIIQLKYTDIQGQAATKLFKGTVSIQE